MTIALHGSRCGATCEGYGLLLAEFFCLLTALATTTIASKTGSTTGLAGAFYENPTFLQEFWVNLAGIHTVLGVLAGGIVVSKVCRA